MSSRVSHHSLALLVLLCLAPDAAADEPALVQGLSHVPVAVEDLAAARKRYEQLGFAFKPGRPHESGIENLHIKFRDGTEVELITAREARDDLTAEYVAFLRRGDGPAFFAIHAADQPGVLRALRAAGLKARQSRRSPPARDASSSRRVRCCWCRPCSRSARTARSSA